MTVAGDEMSFFVCALAVFGITLIVTKSKILACKREFVQKRYASAWVGNQRPSFLHTLWHAWWTCPMCLGFWVALVIAPWSPIIFYPLDVLALFSANWLLHCVETFLFEIGNFLEKLVDKEEKINH